MPADDDATKAAFDRLEKLLEFPVENYPIKVMGKLVDDFAQQIAELVRCHVPDFDPASIDLRSSSRGNWLSLTLVMRIDSREQLEALYRDLAAHPLVRIVL